jgi:hypothetical protein
MSPDLENSSYFFVLKFNMNLENGPEFKRNKFKKESSIDALKEYLLAA